MSRLTELVEDLEEPLLVVWCPRCRSSFIFSTTDPLLCRKDLPGRVTRDYKPCKTPVEPWAEATAAYLLSGHDSDVIRAMTIHRRVEEGLSQ